MGLLVLKSNWSVLKRDEPKKKAQTSGMEKILFGISSMLGDTGSARSNSTKFLHV